MARILGQPGVRHGASLIWCIGCLDRSLRHTLDPETFTTRKNTLDRFRGWSFGSSAIRPRPLVCIDYTYFTTDGTRVVSHTCIPLAQHSPASSAFASPFMSSCITIHKSVVNDSMKFCTHFQYPFQASPHCRHPQVGDFVKLPGQLRQIN